jgi:hypothetical protein
VKFCRAPGSAGPSGAGTATDERSIRRRFCAAVLTIAVAAMLVPPALGQAIRGTGASQTKFRRIPTQFIAALGEPGATSGNNAQHWGLWRKDPGPRGVNLARIAQLRDAGGIAPARWQFDSDAWWLEEHGLIMEAPEFPLPPGRYWVTGNRSVQAGLTIHPPDRDGNQAWALDDGATLHDVTHLACRSALYTPAAGGGECKPESASVSEFPVSPGAAMPPVARCAKQDYAVLIVTGVAIDN